MENKSVKFSEVKKSLQQHHKDVVLRFHKKHHPTLYKAKRSVLTAATAAIIAGSFFGFDHHHKALKIKQLHKQELVSTHNFVKQIKTLLQDKNSLLPQEENVLAEALSKDFSLNLKVSLEGNRLNEIYGYMGAEQHLIRWKGDSLSQHGMHKSGIAPLQGSFKDFDNEEQEKYYVAVQLHELPNWNKDWHKLKPWYRYRKVFVFNPENQKGVVAVIGDSGPSKFTGKTFGGSPELMEYLNMVDGKQKGKAIILFIDDPDNKIALGPATSPSSEFLAENTK